MIEESPAGGISIAAGAYNDVYNNTSREHGGTISVSGLKIINSLGNEIWNNSFSKNMGNGILISSAQGNLIHSNKLIENKFDGISIVTGNHNEIYFNNISKNEDYGIYINSGFNNTIQENLIRQNDDPNTSDGDGIHLRSSEANYIRNNTITENDDHGIYFEDSIDIEIENNVLYENDRGIYGFSSNASLIQFNRVVDNGYGVWLSYCQESVIQYNNASLQFADGIRLSDSVDNEIVHNIANENGVGALPSRGIALDTSSDYNYIFNNTCLSTRGYGIGISQSDFNEIRSNNLSKNVRNGIDLYSSKGNFLTDNYAGENENGVRIWSTSHGFATINNSFTGNYFIDNDNGLYFYQYANDTFVSNNSFIDSVVQGVYLTENNYDNIFTENQFQGNALHARDDAVNTYWSYSGRGNYWDNYTGTDADDDGIGDTPYTFISGLANSEDPYPIYEDGDELPPIIDVLLPLATEFFSIESPDFEVEIVEFYINCTWYTVDGGVSKYFFNGTEGKIDQSLWNSLVDGSITLTFYVNDSIGNQDQDSVIITKDTIAPSIEINEPSPDQVFGVTSPIFNLTITEINLNSSWYTINGDLTKYYFTGDSSINQTAWDSLLEGDVTITFYVEDKAGNVSSESITVKKELPSTPPAIPGYSLLIIMGFIVLSGSILGYQFKRKH
jgi:parallel beta-helix repeat protein